MNQRGGFQWATLFARNPRLVILVVGLALVAGLNAISALPRQEDPILSGRYMTTKMYYPGATAEQVEALVAQPVEDALHDVSEIANLWVTSKAAFIYVGVELAEDIIDVGPVWSRVRDKINDAHALMPDGVTAPEYEIVLPEAETVIIGLSWVGEGPVSETLLSRLALDLKDHLRRLPGTKAVDLFAEPTEELAVTYDPEVLASLGLTPNDLSGAIAASDVKDPAGTLIGDTANLVIEVDGALSGVDRVRGVTVRQMPNGGNLRVGDLAEVTKGVVSPPAEIGLVSGRRAIMIGARMKLGNRVDIWAADARAVIEEFSRGAPSQVSVELLFDQSVFTQDRLVSLTENMLMGVALVMVVLFVMMGWRSALLVGTALPLTVLSVIFLFNVLEVPLHQISVTGLIIALGLLIDNAIVAVDEYDRSRVRGHAPLEAVGQVVSHLTVPLGASTVTTVLTFAPMVLLPGNVGEFVGTLGTAVMLSVGASLFFALTVVPALARFMDRGGMERVPSGEGGGRTGYSNPRLTAGYAAVLDWLFARPWRASALSALPAVLGFVLAPTLAGQFFPPVDRGQFQMQVSLPSYSSIDRTHDVVNRVRDILNTHPEVVDSHWVVGGNPPKVFYNTIFQGDGEPAYAAGFVNTVSPEATRSLLPRLQREVMEAIPEAEVLAIPFEQGPPYDAPVEVEIYGPDLDTLRTLGEEVRRLLATTDGITYTRGTLITGRPNLKVTLDEDEALASGRTQDEVAQALFARQEGLTGGTVLEGLEELDVRVRAADGPRGSLESLENSPLPRPDLDQGEAQATGGSTVPLSAIGTLSVQPTIQSIPRYQGERRNTIQGFIEPFALASLTLADFQRRLEASGLVIPEGYRLTFGGESKESSKSQRQLAATLGPLVVVMIGVLVLAFGSFRQAGLIGLVALLSMGMAFLSVWIFHFPMGFMVLVGGMGLIGISINDSIVVLSALRADPDAMRGDRVAARRVVVEGSRHVLATTLTTIGGFTPLLMFGGNFWQPLATAISGGMVGATALALVFVPSVFLLMNRRRAKGKALVPHPAE